MSIPATSTSSRWRVSPQGLTIVLLVLAYGLLFSWLTVARHDTWHSNVFDLGIFDQVVWNTARGHFFETSIYGVPTTQLGEHFSPVLAAFAPLYLVWNDVRLLLVFQSFYIAAGAVPVYLLASRILELRGGAVLLAAAFLMYPSVAFANLFDFHPDTLLVLLLPWAFYFLYIGRVMPFLVTTALILTVKEDAALLVFAMGLYAAVFAGRRRIGAVLAVVGLCWFLVAINVAIPYFREGQTYGHLSRFSYLGATPVAIALNLATHPLNTLQILFSDQNLGYLFQVLSPLGFLPLLNPAAAMISAPILLGNLITDFQPQHTIFFQYSVSLGPIFFAASIEAIVRLSSRARELWPAANVRKVRLAFAVAVFLTGVYGLARDNPIGHHLSYGAFSPRQNEAALERARQLIPAGASLAVSNTLGAKFVHRPQVSIALEPSSAEYMLVDGTDASIGKLDNLELIAPQSTYLVLLEEGSVILLKRR